MLHFNMITNYGQTGRVTKVECGALHAPSRLHGPHIYGQEKMQEQQWEQQMEKEDEDEDEETTSLAKEEARLTVWLL